MSVTEQQEFLREKCFVKINRGIERTFLKKGWNSCKESEKSELTTPRGRPKCFKNSESSSCSEVKQRGYRKGAECKYSFRQWHHWGDQKDCDPIGTFPISSSKEQTINQQENLKLWVKTDAGRENQSFYYSFHLILLKPYKSFCLVTRHYVRPYHPQRKWAAVPTYPEISSFPSVPPTSQVSLGGKTYSVLVWSS